MPPLIPILSVFAAGGGLVAHSSGGVIASTATTGYVAGTYLSSSAVASLVAGASAALGTGILTLSGFASAIVGSAGIFGTTIGASGLTGFLMSVGLMPATPIWVPIAVGGTIIGSAYIAYLLLRLRLKLKRAASGKEVVFTDREAKIIELIVKWLAKNCPEAIT